jgi:ParB-like chromosome segregation protein Spo0J
MAKPRKKAGATEPAYPLHPICRDYADFLATEAGEMRKSLRELGLLKPVVLWRKQIVDGRHREMFCRELGIETRYDDITDRCKTEEDMRAYVAALNQHRRSRTKPLTVKEKREKVGAALTADPERSDRAIAEECGVSHTFVAEVRRAARGGNVATDPAQRRSRSGRRGEGQRSGPAMPPLADRKEAAFAELKADPKVRDQALIKKHSLVQSTIDELRARLAREQQAATEPQPEPDARAAMMDEAAAALARNAAAGDARARASVKADGNGNAQPVDPDADPTMADLLGQADRHLDKPVDNIAIAKLIIALGEQNLEDADGLVIAQYLRKHAPEMLKEDPDTGEDGIDKIDGVLASIKGGMAIIEHEELLQELLPLWNKHHGEALIKINKLHKEITDWLPMTQPGRALNHLVGCSYGGLKLEKVESKYRVVRVEEAKKAA